LLVRRHRVAKSHVGLSIRKIDLPKACRVLAVVRDECKSLVSDDTCVEADDCLIILVEKDSEDDLAEFFDDAQREK
jgi:NhaP-type Na+/H+ and K+/H+ antiporter